ncbi:hypothetical protein ABBQ32_003786 [Trebouxia sp. C0010 RCD-2024]
MKWYPTRFGETVLRKQRNASNVIRLSGDTSRRKWVRGTDTLDLTGDEAGFYYTGNLAQMISNHGRSSFESL